MIIGNDGLTSETLNTVTPQLNTVQKCRPNNSSNEKITLNRADLVPNIEKFVLSGKPNLDEVYRTGENCLRIFCSNVLVSRFKTLLQFYPKSALMVITQMFANHCWKSTS